jgi:predicted dienelactone hydrolase
MRSARESPTQAVLVVPPWRSTSTPDFEPEDTKPMRLHSVLLRGTAAILASLCVTAQAAEDPAAPPRSEFKAGEIARQTSSRSAALRNRGNPAIRILVWYPAAASEVESPVDVGPDERPVFLAGAVAKDAAFADRQRHPVVLLSHGFGGTGRQMTWLGAALARAGYVAVAVDHPGTNGIDGISAEGAYAPWERAGDLAAALDLVLGDPMIAPHLDGGRVGAGGFSMGGFAAALLAGGRADFGNFNAFCASPKRAAICEKQVEFPADYAQLAGTLDTPALAEIRDRESGNWRDPRIKAALLIAPALGPALNAASLQRIGIPVEVIYGTADPVAPAASNALLIGRSIPGAGLIPLQGVGHYDFLSECSEGARQARVVYCADGLGTTRRETHARSSSAAIAFFDATLRGRP